MNLENVPHASVNFTLWITLRWSCFMTGFIDCAVSSLSLSPTRRNYMQICQSLCWKTNLFSLSEIDESLSNKSSTFIILELRKEKTFAHCDVWNRCELATWINLMWALETQIFCEHSPVLEMRFANVRSTMNLRRRGGVIVSEFLVKRFLWDKSPLSTSYHMLGVKLTAQPCSCRAPTVTRLLVRSMQLLKRENVIRTFFQLIFSADVKTLWKINSPINPARQELSSVVMRVIWDVFKLIKALTKE